VGFVLPAVAAAVGVRRVVWLGAGGHLDVADVPARVADLSG
jgi:hypothetical protein